MQLNFVKVILKWLTQKPATRLYPFEVREPFKNTRGHIVIDSSGCNYCTLCQKRCPTEAIMVNRDNKIWAIDVFRCIQCGACVEGCNKGSLSVSNVAPEPQEKKTIYSTGTPPADNAEATSCQAESTECKEKESCS